MKKFKEAYRQESIREHKTNKSLQKIQKGKLKTEPSKTTNGLMSMFSVIWVIKQLLLNRFIALTVEIANAIILFLS